MLANKIQPNTGSILFIAHGLGAWIAKIVLATRIIQAITSYDKVMVMILDVNTEKNVCTSYPEYLKRNWTQFDADYSIPPADAELRELCSYLQRIDNNFDDMIVKYNEARANNNNQRAGSKRVYQADITIGMLKGGLKASNDVCSVTELSECDDADNYLAQLKHPTPRLPNMHGILVIMGVIRDPTCHPMIPDPSEASEAYRPIEESVSLGEPWTYPSHTKPLGYGNASSRRPRAASVVFAAEQTGAGDVVSYLPPTATIAASRAKSLADNGDDDTISVTSSRNEGLIIINSHVLSAYQEAKFLFRRGALGKARLLFIDILEHESLYHEPLQKIHIQMKIASIEIYLGFYEKSEKNLLRIEQELNKRMTAVDTDQSIAQLQYRCRGLLTSCRFHAGQWEKAATETRSLIRDSQNRCRVRLYRDLSLVYAHLGQYFEARAALRFANVLARQATIGENRREKTAETHIPLSEDQRESERKQGDDLQIKNTGRQVAEATIDILEGKYHAALTTSSEALGSMEKKVGFNHFRTLAIATLKAWCLAYDGQYNDAKTLSLATYQATTRALGPSHPQTLDVMGCLVYVYKCQGWFANAIGTANSMNSLLNEWEAERKSHPQAIRSKFLLAVALRANGEYTSSKLTIDGAIDDAERIMGKKHPETLRYKYEKARILHALGNASEAWSHSAVRVVLKR